MSKGPEQGFQDTLVEYARTCGWLVAHFRRAAVRAGRVATPVAYDAAGFPDLVLVRKDRVVFAELKRKGVRKVSPEQQKWARALIGVEAENPGVTYVVWNPIDWETPGGIRETLR